MSFDSARRWSCFVTILCCQAAGPALLAGPADDEEAAVVESPPPDVAGEGEKPPSFLRVKRDAAGTATALETAVVRYVPASKEGGLTVDLIGAVHVGDRDYYDALNKKFEEYDVLLYELVAPPGHEVPTPDRESDNPLAMIQQLATSVLDLELQVQRIDYTKPNFVHADLSPDQMAAAIRRRGDDGLTLFLGVTADMLRQANRAELRRQEQPAASPDDEEFDLLSALFDETGPLKLKRTLAEQFETQAAGEIGLGDTLNTILIADRNRAALRVFQTELAKGKKRIGIFYGAAHLPDFEKRLQADFGLKRDREDWLTAWDLREGRRGKPAILRLLEE